MSTFRKRYRSIHLSLSCGLVLLLLLLASCSFGSAPSQPESSEIAGTTSPPLEEADGPSANLIEEPAGEEARVNEEVELAAAPAGEAATTELESYAGNEDETTIREPASPSTAAMSEPDGDMAADAESPAMVESQQVNPLRAGEVDDNAQWDDYLLYRRQYQGLPVHDRDVSERYLIEVKDAQGQPVLGADVRIFLANGGQRQEIYSARTYANGQALFHPLALDLSLEQVDSFVVEVQKDNLVEDFTLTRLNAQVTTSFSERWTVTLDTQQRFDRLNLDVLFLIDATGSMADEIAKIQDTIFDVSARIDALPGQPDVRYGMVTYRDRGDTYVTQTYDFTPDVQEFSRDLSTVEADGGGDTPESLNEALHEALSGVEWRGGDTVQLIFLVADAAPHLDYPQDYDYAVEMENAARRGIKIFPLASSGLDEQGEYIYRQLAQYTMGRFLFLTYAGPTNGGAPGDVTTHHVEDYSVENLDDLLVKLVEGELAHQQPQRQR